MRKFFISLLMVLAVLPVSAQEIIKADLVTHMLRYDSWKTNSAGIILVCVPKRDFPNVTEFGSCGSGEIYVDHRFIIPPGKRISGYQIMPGRYPGIVVLLR